MAVKMNPDMVRAEVARFWKAFQNKDAAGLSDFYTPECSVFGSLSRRPEPGRLAAVRRNREYFGRLSVLRISISDIDVVILGDASAVATYTFEFHATGTAVLGQPDEHIVHGRCSHVFAFDQDGKLKIFHEHMSVPAA